MFGEAFDVAEHAQMNVMNDHIGPQRPVFNRPHAVAIPACPIQPRAPAGKGGENKFRLAGDEVAVQGGWRFG